MSEPKKYAYIDSLRGIAILLVLLIHVSQLIDRQFFNPGMISFFENGQLGVQLFFMVSAYTLMLSNYAREGENGFNRNFFIRRFFRIAPLYYLVTFYYAFERYLGFDPSLFAENIQSFPFVKLITGMLFINGLYPTTINSFVPGGWSIAIEMLFYATLPFIFKRVRSLNQSIVLLFCSVFAAVIFSYITAFPFFNRAGFPMFNFLNQFPIFSLGIVAFFIHKDGLTNINSKNYFLLAILFLAYCYLPFPYYMHYSVFFLLLLLGLSKNPLPIIVNPVITFIGKISFSIYLIHFAVLYWTKKITDPYLQSLDNKIESYLYLVLLYVFVLAVSSIISYVSYKFVEIPGQQMGKRIIKRFS